MIRDLAGGPAPWLGQDDAAVQPIISTRVRLARNLTNYAFPGRCGVTDRRKIRSRIAEVLDQLRCHESDAFFHLSAFNQLQLSLLKERKLTTREHVKKRAGSAIYVSPARQLTSLINEQDHLRSHVLLPGNQLSDAWHILHNFDEAVIELLPMAKSPSVGYYCASPLNTGSGLRLSALMHLPALAIADRLEPIANASEKLGFPFHGSSGLRSAPLGCLFQVDSQATTPGTEDDLIGKAHAHFNEISRIEEETRQFLLESRPEFVYDHIARAWALLRSARLLDSAEAINNLLALRLGLSLNMFSTLSVQTIDDLLMGIRPAHLQFRAGKPLSKFERDCERAQLVQSRLAKAIPTI
jgi:protein arginine kinase